MERTRKLALLIVDDQVEVLDVYRDVLHEHLGHDVESASHPAEATRYVRDRLFDMVIVDAKLAYKGAMLGGLILAHELSQVLGLESLLLMSQYDVRGEVAHFNPGFAFLPKPRDGRSLVTWAEKELLARIQAMVGRQYGFVVMPYGLDEADRWYRGVLAPWMREAGYELRRMDEIATTKAINVEMLEKIRQAHFVVVYVSRDNANVYFEAGFATALGKFSLLFAPSVEALPFDVQANHVFTIAEGADEAARNSLLRFMGRLRGIRQ